MKTIRFTIIAAAIILTFAIHSFAVVDQRLEIQDENLVLSWPSTGNEYYLVQHRTTLDPETPWTTLTNNYPANSTNRTTLVIPCCDLPPFSLPAAGGGTNSGGGEPPAPGSSMAMSQSSKSESSTELWAKQSSGSAVPLALFPPGWDTSDMTIFEVEKSENQAQSFSGESLESFDGGSDEPMNLSSGGCDCPDMAFFRVFHIPDFSVTITNYTFDGPIFIPVDFADYRDRVDNIEVVLNGEPTPYSELISLFYNGQTNWGMGIYFGRMASGTYQIQLRSTLMLNDEVGENSAYLVLSNLTRSITVDNQVTFTNWDDMIWNNTNYTFRAQTKTNVTDWQIDIYDAFGGYVNGASGHTTNGQVEWTWDLKDTANNTRDILENDPFFDPYITFAVAGTDANTTRAKPLTILPYPSVGEWVVAYQNTYYEPGTTAGTHFINAMNAIGGWIDYRDVPVNMRPIKFGTNSYTQAERNESWAFLKAYLFRRENRNFYYFGHGNETRISCDMHTYSNNVATGGQVLPGSKAFLNSLTISNEITFNKHGGVRPYRFVFLDGCDTANGDLPGAFGINKATNSIGYYTNSATNPSHKRPSAFVGWATTVGGTNWGTVQATMNFRSEWIFDWSYYWNTDSLIDAFDEARVNANWPPGGANQLWNSLRVFGYRDLRMNQYNQKTDWPGP